MQELFDLWNNYIKDSDKNYINTQKNLTNLLLVDEDKNKETSVWDVFLNWHIRLKLKQDKINNDWKWKYDNNVFLKIYEESVYPALFDRVGDKSKSALEKIKKNILWLFSKFWWFLSKNKENIIVCLQKEEKNIEKQIKNQILNLFLDETDLEYKLKKLDEMFKEQLGEQERNLPMNTEINYFLYKDVWEKVFLEFCDLEENKKLDKFFLQKLEQIFYEKIWIY